jgi:hypothetical protein
MPITVSWHNDEHTVIRLTFHAPWALPDLSESIESCYALLRSTDAPVDAIWDASEISGIPHNLLSHFILRSPHIDIPPNQRAVLVVARSPFLKSFLSAARRALPARTRKMYIFDDLGAAERFIESLRLTMPES